MSPLGFKGRVGSALFAFCRGECNVHSPRSTSGATHANFSGTQPITSPHACAEVGLGSDSNGQSPGQKTNALPLYQRPGSNPKNSYLTCKKTYNILVDERWDSGNKSHGDEVLLLIGVEYRLHHRVHV